MEPEQRDLAVAAIEVGLATSRGHAVELAAGLSDGEVEEILTVAGTGGAAGVIRRCQQAAADRNATATRADALRLSTLPHEERFADQL